MGRSGGGAEYTVSVINKVNQQERSELASRTPRPEVLEGCGPRCNSPLQSQVLVASLEPGFHCGGSSLSPCAPGRTVPRNPPPPPKG